MSNTTRKYFVVYDIADDKRRAKVFKLLRSFGAHIQYSVFVIDLKPARMLRLKKDLTDIVDCGEDSVVIVDLGLADSFSDKRISQLGYKVVSGERGAIVV